MDKPIRVLHVLQRMEAAGVQTLLMSIYRKIDRSKIQFDFLVQYEEDQFFDREIESMGGRIYKFSIREDYNLYKYIKQLDKFFEEHKEFSIIHGHMPILGYFYLGAAHKAGVPVRIAHAHTNQHSKSLKGYIASGIKHLYGVHATDYFACSESAGKYIFGSKRPYKVLKNAISTDKFVFNEDVREKTRKKLGIEDKFVVGHVARFAEHKNHDFLIDVFYEIKKIRVNSILLLAGDGELKKQIEEKVNLLGLKDDVIFLGVRSDMNELYQAMDAFVFPSIFEGLGIVNIEAQASGLLTFCSTAVPQEANISPLYSSIPLDKGAEYWAKLIVDTYDNRDERHTMDEYVKKSGYDVETLAMELQKFYLAKVKDAI